MRMSEILIRQKELLSELRDLLEKEKKVLICENGEELSLIVEAKKKLASAIEETEQMRKQACSGFESDELEIGEEEKKEIQAATEKIREIYSEIRNYQRINLMLTQQSLDFQSMLMDIIQKSIQKAGTYGKNGKVNNSPKIKAALDKSV